MTSADFCACRLYDKNQAHNLQLVESSLQVSLNQKQKSVRLVPGHAIRKMNPSSSYLVRALDL